MNFWSMWFIELFILIAVLLIINFIADRYFKKYPERWNESVDRLIEYHNKKCKDIDKNNKINYINQDDKDIR